MNYLLDTTVLIDGLRGRRERRKGRTLTLADMIVAATAMEHDLTLVTDNRKDFPMRGLKVYAMAQG